MAHGWGEDIRRAAVSIRLRIADAADVVLGRRGELVPPRRLRGPVGNSDFVATGDEFGGYLRDLTALSPHDRVLDVGCGAGRLARVLARELSPPGSYDGFDVMPTAISWCRKHYRGAPAPFRFVHADLYNGMYNRGAATKATEYRFPYADEQFDLVVATSVFTHLRRDEADHYLGEVARVLAPKGRFLSTWFLMEQVPVPEGDPMIAFHRTEGPEATADRALPEAAVGYDSDWLFERLSWHGLRLRLPVARGTWAGGPGPSSQDIVVVDAG